MTCAGKCLHNGDVIGDDADALFKALGDPTRRRLLDHLRERNGQTLGDLCSRIEMTRQSTTQHLDLLVQAHLVTVIRSGRERLHYLNPVPIHEFAARWISQFDSPRLQTLMSIKSTAEEHAMTNTHPSPLSYVYVTYIHASPEQVWNALTDADLTASYWGHANVSDWQVGSTWEHRRTDGSGIADVTGTVMQSEPPTRLVITFGEGDSPEEQSLVTFVIEPYDDIVRLSVTHERIADQQALTEISHGWPAVLANLKSLLETGDVLPQAPWDMRPMP